MNSPSAIERDRMNLERAAEHKKLANESYKQKDYISAMRDYHRSLLYARAVSQLSNMSMQMLARKQMDYERRQNEELKKPKDYGSYSDSDSLNSEDIDIETEKSNGVTKSDNTKDEKDERIESIDQSSSTSSSESESPREAASRTARSRIDSTARGEELRDEARAIMAACYNNLAACLINGPQRDVSDYLRACTYCDNVLEHDENNAKALWRKAQAMMKAGKYERAIELFMKSPESSLREGYIANCKAKLVQERRERDAKIRDNFAKAGLYQGDNHANNGAPMNGSLRQ